MAEEKPIAILTVRVKPGASRNEIRLVDGVLIIAVRARPIEGQANRAVEELIAARLGVAKSNVSIIRNPTGKLKTVQVFGITQAECDARCLIEDVGM